MLGEFRSASMIATLRPFIADAAAIFTASMLLPTPPRALASAIVAPTPERLVRIRSRTPAGSADPALSISENILINWLLKSVAVLTMVEACRCYASCSDQDDCFERRGKQRLAMRVRYALSSSASVEPTLR